MSSNINKTDLINKILKIDGLTNEERSSLLEMLRHHKKYGLVWEDKPEDVEERLRDELPVLREVKDKYIPSDAEDAPNHIIIEGDNLEALTALSYTHEGKIDVIYIDPPYNTGNKDFVYNDSFVDSEDSYRHSKWLSFMNKRLKIAKRLLTERGVIFMSIDDNEQANLKLLCDEIFGYDCFYGDIAWQRSYSPRNDSKGISVEKEHLLVYSKDTSWIPKKLPRTAEMDSKYGQIDGDEIPWRADNPCAPGAATHQGMVYAIQNPFSGEYLYPNRGGCWRYQQNDMLEIMRGWGDYELKIIHDEEQRARVCNVSVDSIRPNVPAIVLSQPLEQAKKFAEGIIKRGKWPLYYFTKNGKGGIAKKTYLNPDNGKVVTNLWLHVDVGHTDEAKKEIAKVFSGEKPFDTPKPSRLIERILQITGDNESTVLDFFAGSGTTLHATIQLNAEDGGHRQCILVTNNENGICENVTYERNKRVINGYTTPKGVEVEGLHNNKLRYYRTDFIPRDRTQKNMRDLVNASTDLLCIKEDLYDEQSKFGRFRVNPRLMRYFSDGKKHMLVVYREEIVDQLAAEIENLDFGKEKLKIYIFSPARYAFNDNFDEVSDKVTLVALPAAIYDAYEKVLPKRKEKLFELEEEKVVKAEPMQDLFSGQEEGGEE